MKIINNNKDSFDLEVKRFFVPGLVIEDTCPECGFLCVRDYSRDYFSYPEINSPANVHFYCEAHDSWTRQVVIKIEVSPA